MTEDPADYRRTSRPSSTRTTTSSSPTASPSATTPRSRRRRTRTSSSSASTSRICVDEAGDPDPTFTCAGRCGRAAAELPGPDLRRGAGRIPGRHRGRRRSRETGVIGAIGGIESIPPVKSYIGGYANGAQSVNPDIEVLISYVSEDITIAFNDPTTGASLAEQMIGQDADVIFQVAGLSGQGALEAACDAGHLRHRRRRRPGARPAGPDRASSPAPRRSWSRRSARRSSASPTERPWAARCCSMPRPTRRRWAVSRVPQPRRTC